MLVHQVRVDIGQLEDATQNSSSHFGYVLRGELHTFGGNNMLTIAVLAISYN